MARAVEIRLLGTFQILVDGQECALPTGTQRLVALLALRGRTGRSRIAGWLWPDVPEDRALASLRTGIWRVNQAIDGLVVSAHGVVSLGLSPQIDVRWLVERSRELLAGAATVVVDRDLDDSGGELLPDWDHPWLDTDRERLRQLRLHVLEASADRLAATGQYGMALECALAAVRADELRESAHRSVIRIHLAEGNLAEAMRAYEQCSKLLWTDLAIHPSEATRALLSSVSEPPAVWGPRQVATSPRTA